MKLSKYISIVVLAILVGVSSCGDQFDLDLQNDPNAVTEENADVDLFFNAIQLNFAAFFDNASNISMSAVRMTAMTGGDIYENAWSPNTFNFLWNNSYSSIFPDVVAMNALAEERSLFYHTGAAKVIQGYVLMTMVDFFGDIPWTEALDGVSTPSPASDDDQTVYDVAIALLDAGIADLTNPESIGAPLNDLFFSDADGWVRAANSIKLKAYMNTGNTVGANAIITAGNFIASSADDFQFTYGTNRVNPNSRHPKYSEQYEVGNGRYHSNAYMYNMRFRHTNIDPRVRYYYYRQDLDASDEDQFTLACVNAPRPPHYANEDPFCLASVNAQDATTALGYWGRDHGNNDGIPPDGAKRTVWGAYPAAGKFDADDGTDVKNQGVDGGLGAGIQPIMMSSFVDFMRGELALGAGDNATARMHLENGMRNSIAKVMSFSASVTTVDPNFVPSQADIDAYVAEILTDFDNANADGKADVMQQQNQLALFGNGIEAYNAYRRTTFPANLQPTREPNGGNFPRLMLYPADYVNLNASISSNRDLTEQVFWDTNGPGVID